MNKIISGIIIASALAVPFVSFASTSVVCNFPDHKIYNQDGNAVVGCISDAVWEANMTASLSAQNPKLPVMSSGITVIDQFGIPYTCPAWFGFWKCIDDTKTTAHIQTVKSIASQILASFGDNVTRAEQEFPLYQKAIDSVKSI